MLPECYGIVGFTACHSRVDGPEVQHWVLGALGFDEFETGLPAPDDPENQSCPAYPSLLDWMTEGMYQD